MALRAAAPVKHIFMIIDGDRYSISDSIRLPFLVAWRHNVLLGHQNTLQPSRRLDRSMVRDQISATIYYRTRLQNLCTRLGQLLLVPKCSPESQTLVKKNLLLKQHDGNCTAIKRASETLYVFSEAVLLKK